MFDHAQAYAEGLKNTPTELLKIQPIDTLFAETGMVLLIAESDLTTTPYVTYVGYRDAKTGRILSYNREGIEGNYGTPVVAWTVLPFNEVDVQVAVSRAAAAVEDDIQKLHDDLSDIVMDRGTFGKGRVVMSKIHAFFEQHLEGVSNARLTPAMRTAYLKVNEWVNGDALDDEERIADDLRVAFAK